MVMRESGPEVMTLRAAPQGTSHSETDKKEGTCLNNTTLEAAVLPGLDIGGGGGGRPVGIPGMAGGGGAEDDDMVEEMRKDF